MRGKIKIELSQEARKKIMKAFGVGYQTVTNALNFSGDGRGQTELARKIRKAAMENGGKRMAYFPAFETAHTHNGIMRQEFDNGATLEADMHTGRVEVKDPKGVLRKVSENVSIPELYVLQNMAMAF